MHIRQRRNWPSTVRPRGNCKCNVRYVQYNQGLSYSYYTHFLYILIFVYPLFYVNFLYIIFFILIFYTHYFYTHYFYTGIIFKLTFLYPIFFYTLLFHYLTHAAAHYLTQQGQHNQMTQPNLPMHSMHNSNHELWTHVR